MANETIYILDQVTPKAGRAQEFLKAYMDRYAPGAAARGMKHEFTWIGPPMWLENQPNTLFFIWSVQGAPAWWAMEHQARRDPSVMDWWREADTMIETRRRSFLSNVSDVASLTNV